MPNSSIITRCPHCQIAFRVSDAQLNVANGAVRCGSCLSIFKASDHEVRDETTRHQNTTNIEKPIRQKTKPAKQTKAKPSFSLDIDEELLQDNKKTDKASSHKEQKDESDELYFFDNETSDTNKTSSIFGTTKSRRITPATQEKADESWALNMLAELEDDDELTLNITKRREKTDDRSANSQPEKAKHKPFSAPSEDISPPEDEFENTLDYEQLAENDELSQSSLTRQSNANEAQNTLGQDEESEFFYDENFEVNDPNNDRFDEDVQNLISDEEIDKAMDSAPSYKQELQGMIKGIQSAPVEIDHYEGENRYKWLWRISVALTILLLAGQITFYRFDKLSKHPTYRPLMTQLCDVIDCQIPEWVALDQIRSNNLIVRNHPSVADALLVDVILINNAKFAQPYPALSLQFSTIDNTIVAASDVQPAQYLRGELAGSQLMPIQQPIQVSLSIEDPGDSAVNYRLDLLSATP